MANLIERLEAATQGVLNARGIDIRVEEPEAAYPYLEILGAAAGQLSLREASAWADFLGAMEPKDVLALLKLARATWALMDADRRILAYPPHREAAIRKAALEVDAAIEPLFREDGTPAPPKGHFAEVTMYIAVCDGCGEQHDHHEFAAWASMGSALDAAVSSSDWDLQDDGRLLCSDCQRKPGGALAEGEEGQQ